MNATAGFPSSLRGLWRTRRLEQELAEEIRSIWRCRLKKISGRDAADEARYGLLRKLAASSK